MSPTLRDAWSAGIRSGREIFRTHSEDRATERDLALLNVWSATVRVLLALLPAGNAHPSTDAWDAMMPESRVAACDGKWFDFIRFTFAVQHAEVSTVLTTTQRN